MASHDKAGRRRLTAKTHGTFETIPSLRVPGKDVHPPTSGTRKAPTPKKPAHYADPTLFPGRRLDRRQPSTHSVVSGKSGLSGPVDQITLPSSGWFRAPGSTAGSTKLSHASLPIGGGSNLNFLPDDSDPWVPARQHREDSPLGMLRKQATTTSEDGATQIKPASAGALPQQSSYSKVSRWHAANFTHTSHLGKPMTFDTRETLFESPDSLESRESELQPPVNQGLVKQQTLRRQEQQEQKQELWRQDRGRYTPPPLKAISTLPSQHQESGRHGNHETHVIPRHHAGHVNPHHHERRVNPQHHEGERHVNPHHHERRVNPQHHEGERPVNPQHHEGERPVNPHHHERRVNPHHHEGERHERRVNPQHHEGERHVNPHHHERRVNPQHHEGERPVNPHHHERRVNPHHHEGERHVNPHQHERRVNPQHHEGERHVNPQHHEGERHVNAHRRPAHTPTVSPTPPCGPGPRLNKILWALAPDEHASMSDAGVSQHMQSSCRETSATGERPHARRLHKTVTLTDLEVASDISCEVPETPRNAQLTEELLCHHHNETAAWSRDDRIHQWLTECDKETTSHSLPTHLPDIQYTFKYLSSAT